MHVRARVAALLAVAAIAACSGSSDETSADAGAPTPDAESAQDGTVPQEAGVDATMDASRDAGVDAAADVTADAALDAAADVTADVAADAAPEAAPDAAADAAPDVDAGAASHCYDGVMDGDETGVDCGGATCNAIGKVCPVGQPCVGPQDCITLDCDSSHLCAARPNGFTCTASVQCASNVCLAQQGGGPLLCCVSACPTQPPDTCGTTGQCSPTGKDCAVYYNNTTCHACTGSTLATGHCNGSIDGGACVPTTSNACPGNLLCGSSTACLATCSVSGSPPNGTSVGCVAGYYCDTVPSQATCNNALKATSAACKNGFECASGTCAGGACQ
jgi:hypothetical protein